MTDTKPDASEKAIQGAILVALSAIDGCLVWRQHSGVYQHPGSEKRITVGVRGMADIGGMIHGRAFQIEVKRPGGRQSEHQKRWQRWVLAAGGVYAVCRSVEEAVAVVEGLGACRSLSLTQSIG